MKINIEYDTVSKSLVLTKDGKAVKQFSSITFYNYGDENNYMELREFKYDDENKMSETHTTVAKLLGL